MPPESGVGHPIAEPGRITQWPVTELRGFPQWPIAEWGVEGGDTSQQLIAKPRNAGGETGSFSGKSGSAAGGPTYRPPLICQCKGDTPSTPKHALLMALARGFPPPG